MLGAGGAIAQHVIEFLKNDSNIELTLLARNTVHLQAYNSLAQSIEGDVLNDNDLDDAIKG